MTTYNIAIIGATGNVGRKILDILDERQFPINNIYALASEKSSGKIITYGNRKSISAESLATFDFSKVEIILSSAGSIIAKQFIPEAQKKGCIIIDNSSCYRMDINVPLVIPEVNPSVLTHVKKGDIISNPNCSTIQMLVALKPIHDAFKLKRVIVSTYQSVSGAGKNAIDELKSQISQFGRNEISKITPEEFTKQICANIIPHIDVFMEDDSTKEEWKMSQETRKILGSDIKVHANCARVPVFNSHAEYINVETHEDIDVKSVRKILNKSHGIKLIDRDNEKALYATQIDVSGTDDVFVSRIRKDHTVNNGISFWCVADNLRKGAALNAVQIAELLIK